MSIEFPVIDPVAFDFLGLEVRWYSLSYMLGILLGVWCVKYLDNDGLFDKEEFYNDLTLYLVLGIVLGGRIGYVLFYNPEFYLNNPLALLKIWNGGMSAHGGIIGLSISMYILSKNHNQTDKFLNLMDHVAIVSSIGIFLGRLANFINAELYGRVTDVPWGIIFPNAGPLPRHPSQLYEALGEGLILFILTFSLAKFTRILNKKGVLSTLYIILYSIIRIFIEQYREPDEHIGFIFNSITLGQILSAIFVVIGILILIYVLRCTDDKLIAYKHNKL